MLQHLPLNAGSRRGPGRPMPCEFAAREHRISAWLALRLETPAVVFCLSILYRQLALYRRNWSGSVGLSRTSAAVF